MLELYDLVIAPFTHHLFLKRALIACLVLSLSSAPLGIFIVLRRMSLMGDALSHSALPGFAIAFALTGMSILWMSLGGFIAGLVVALVAGVTSRMTVIQEDASLVGFYLIALALGVVIVSSSGNAMNLTHILFGDVLGITRDSLMLICVISSLSLCTLAVIYRGLVLECFDPDFLRSFSKSGSLFHLLFIVLVVANLVSAFHALGVMMALGLMMLPAVAARFWTTKLETMCLIAIAISFASCYVGLLLSYYFPWPSGASIVLVAGIFYSISLVFGTSGSFRVRLY